MLLSKQPRDIRRKNWVIFRCILVFFLLVWISFAFWARFALVQCMGRWCYFVIVVIALNPLADLLLMNRWTNENVTSEASSCWNSDNLNMVVGLSFFFFIFFYFLWTNFLRQCCGKESKWIENMNREARRKIVQKYVMQHNRTNVSSSMLSEI